jgi:large subunit ribosomal protein L7/L12
MIVLKKGLVSLVMAASLAVVSSSALAAPEGEAKVKEAIESTLSGIATSQADIQRGDMEAASKDILLAAQASKEFRFEITERQREKATNLLKGARKSVQDGNAAAAAEGLEKALASFSEMKAKYELTH